MTDRTHIPVSFNELLKAAVTSSEPRQQPSFPPLPGAKSWSVSVDRIFADSGKRLDATYFDPAVDAHVGSLPGDQSTPLREMATVVLPERFERVWAIDRNHGRPYLNATDLLSLFSIGIPSRVRFLSPETDANIEKLIIREGWLLMTCSGTIGLVHYVPRRLDGWVATHDLIRIVPNSRDVAGYLFAWCMTSMAQAQIISHTHGGTINHVTDSQVASLLVPSLPKKAMRDINKTVLDALDSRERALEALHHSWPI